MWLQVRKALENYDDALARGRIEEDARLAEARTAEEEEEERRRQTVNEAVAAHHLQQLQAEAARERGS